MRVSEGPLVGQISYYTHTHLAALLPGKREVRYFIGKDNKMGLKRPGVSERGAQTSR